MKRGFNVVAGLIAALFLVSVLAAAQTTDLKEINARLDQFEEKGLSGNLLIVSNGREILRRSIGFRSRNNELPTNAGTLYYAGSLAKQFTAAAVLQLREQGLLSLSDTLDKYFPEISENKRGITIHQLLSHTSGLPSMYGEYLDVVDIEQNVRSILVQELQFEPGEQFSYSNNGYNLLAAIVEKVAGRPFLEYIWENVFKRAGIEGASNTYDVSRLVEAGHADMVAENETAGSPAQWKPTAKRLGAGGLLLSVDHLWRWKKALLSGTIINQESLYLMLHPNANNYGYGMFSKNESGALRWYHTGSLGGFFGFFYTRGDTDFSAFLLTNELPEGLRPELQSLIKDVEQLTLGQ